MKYLDLLLRCIFQVQIIPVKRMLVLHLSVNIPVLYVMAFRDLREKGPYKVQIHCYFNFFS